MFSLQNTRTLTIAVVFTLAGAAGMYAVQTHAQAPKAGEKEKDKTGKAELPAAVKSAADKFFGTTYTHKAVSADGMTQYQCSGVKDGKETEAFYTESGDLFILRKFIKPSEMPESARTNFRSDYKDAKVQRVAEVETHFYAITFEQDGNEQRIKTYPNGRVWRHSDLEEKD